MKAMLGPVERTAWNCRAPWTPNLASAPSSIHLPQVTLSGPPEPVSVQTRAEPLWDFMVSVVRLGHPGVGPALL